MRKTIIVMAILFKILHADSMDGIEKESREEYIFFNESKLINDKTCTPDDIKKIIQVSHDLLHNKTSNPFYRDMCKPFKKIYNVMRKEDDEFTFTKYNKYLQEYKDSQYINFFAFIYNKNLPNGVDENLFKHKNDDISSFMNFYFERPYDDNVRKIKVYFPKYMYTEGAIFLESPLDIIFNQAQSEALIYLRTLKNKKKIKNFLLMVIEKRKERKLSNEKEYLELANIIFEENKFKILNDKRDIAMKFLVLSFKEKKLLTQIELLNKIQLKDIYIEMDKKYPKTLTNLEEYEYIQDKLKDINRLSLNLSNRYYYTIMNKVFLYKKMLYISNSNLNKGLVEKELRKLINITKSRELSREYYLLIEKIKNDKFIIKAIDRMFED